MNTIYRRILTVLFLGQLCVLSCTKNTQLTGNPYPDQPVPFVKFYGKNITSIRASIGDQVTFQIIGVDKLPAGYIFSINQAPAEIIKVTDSLITVKVPENASSGPGSLLTADGQFFYGPYVLINGKVSIDPDFNNGGTTNGTDGPIYNLYNGGSFYTVVGFFTDYNNQKLINPVNSIAKINTSGVYQTSATRNGASGGSIVSILPLSGGKFIIGGSFSTYGSPRFGASNITQLNNDLSIDSMTVALVNPDPDGSPQNSNDTVPRFNGYIYGGVSGVFNDASGSTVAVGNIYGYGTNFYPRSQKQLYYKDNIGIRNFIRFKIDSAGGIDSSYNYSYDAVTGKNDQNLDGSVNGTIQLANKKIIVAGSFTHFNSQAAPGIMAISGDGGLDPDFAASVGSGVDGPIGGITYNSVTQKILITGRFTHYNGHIVNGVAMLNEDGSLVPDLIFRQSSGGFVSFAGQLNNGNIVVSGTFNRYDGVIREGFMILDAHGALLPGYNNTGAFNGNIYGMIEPSNGKLLLYGYFSLFDNTKVGNIIQLNLAP